MKKIFPSYYFLLWSILLGCALNAQALDTFTFVDQTGVALRSVISSNAVTISGISTATPISVSGGYYSINGGKFISTPGTVKNGDQVAVAVISASTHSTQANAILSIGELSDTFTATTLWNGFYSPAASPGSPLFSSEHFRGSEVCAACHNGINDSSGNDVSIVTDWSSTMMANSARDPLWKAKVRSEINRNPQLTDVINDKCTRCHAPMANFEAKTNSEPRGILDGGFLSASHPRHNEAMNGVSCTLCHQIQDAPNLGTLSSFTGHYEIGDDRKIYGPFDNLKGTSMINQTAYTPTYSPHIQSSKICGTCHNLKTAIVDQFGKVISTTPESEFPEQMPYTEWENSSYASTDPKSCQQCHMPRANGVRISNGSMTTEVLEKRDNFGIHEFVGANRLMLDIFNNNKTQLGVLSNNFAETLAKTQAMLNSAATIATDKQCLGVDNELNFTLKVNSTTGHKLPSAYPSRRVVLHVTVKDDIGNIVFESGKINSDGSIVGVNADANRRTFEPHYQLITKPDQVQVYEAIMGDNQKKVTYTLLRGMAYLKDNRILPPGFDKTKAPDDVKVVGAALKDRDFIGGSDKINYRISGLTGAAYTVEAELVHQPLAYSFANDLFQEPDNEVADFKTMFTASSAKSSQIALNSFTVTRRKNTLPCRKQ
jgi:hypothetical protein